MVRAASGGLLFGVPLLYTVEVMWTGQHTGPGQALAVLAVSFVLLTILNRTAGFRGSRDTNFRLAAADAVLEAIEKIVYLGITALLLVASVVLLAVAAKDLLDVFDDFDTNPVVEVLDTLLLLFILVELLSAVRITISKRELVAEPFLLVGIIASIKEIVVLSVKAAESIGDGQSFRDQLWQIGVLGVVVFLLGATAWMLRIKEREPQEGQTNQQ